MKQETGMLDKKVIKTVYRNLWEDQELKTVLTLMQAERGIYTAEADRNTEVLIGMVAGYESVENRLSEDAKAAFDDFLMRSKKMNGYDRKVLLHQLYFGLKLYQDPELVEKQLQGASVDALFREYYARWGEDPTVTEEILEEKIRALVSGMYLSPTAMQLFAQKLKLSNNMLVTSAAMGEQGYRLKCVAAMELYLQKQGTVSLEEAVAVACSDVDMQAAADAYSCGLITEKVVKAILIAAAVGVILWSGHYFFAGDLKTPTVESVKNEFAGSLLDEIGDTLFAHMGEDAKNREMGELAGAAGKAWNAYLEKRQCWIRDEKVFSRYLALFGVELGVISKPISEWMGRLTAKQMFVHSDARAQAADALYALADREKKKVETFEFQELDTDQEARLRAYEQELEKNKKYRKTHW